MANVRIDHNGTKRYFDDDGYLHRDDGPAVIYTSGTKWWFLNDTSHNAFGPVARYYNGLMRNERIDKIPHFDHPNGCKIWVDEDGDQWPVL